MNRIFKYCLLIVTVFISLGIFSQEFKNEEDRKKHADKLFDKGKYIEATPHILHFLSLNQTSPEYNFKYGVCLMYADEDKEKSLRYLKFAASKGGGGDSRVYFFLGKAYHLNYNFKEALKNYQKFKTEGEDNYKKELQVDLHIKMCYNGMQLLQNLTELVVYEKTESSFQRFQYSYDLSDIGGKILVSSEFQSKYDKKQGYQTVVYFPPLNQDILFYSSYGKDGSTGLDLYMVSRGPSGGWGDPEKLPESINTPYDDAYGFLHSDGNTFYFSSKGHNSMGGYDIFKVDYDAQINKFGTPQNLDYKINTPDDDIMYIVDPNFENAYFSSSRAAKGGYLDVYKVKVETFPIVNVILAGQFENKINPEDNAATIKVENMQSGEIEGIYNPDNGGNYIIVLPRSGKYKFIVETPESEKIHTGIVEVPSQKVVKPLKQSLALVKDEGIEKLVINNQFDQEVPNAAEIMAKVLKGMADPEPNADDFPDSLYNVDNSTLVTEALDENYSVDDLIELSADKAKEVQEEANELKKRMEAAYTVANNKSNEAKGFTKQADDVLKEVESISNPLEKQEKIELAKKAHVQSKDYNMLATTALNLANSLKKEYDKKQAEASDANKVAVAIEKAVNENSHDKAIAALKQLQSRIDSLIKDQPNYKSGFDDIVQKSKLKQEEADKANTEAQEYREADDELNLRLKTLNRELDKAKKKDKSTIQRQIEDIKEQLELNDELAKESFEKSARLQKEADELSHQVDLMTNLYDDIDAGTTVELTDEEKQKVKDYLASNELENKISENESILNEQEENSSTNANQNNLENTSDNNIVALTEAQKQEVNQEFENEFSKFEEQLSEVTAINEEGNVQKKEVLENWIAALDSKVEEVQQAKESSSDEYEKAKHQYYIDKLNKQKQTKTQELDDLENILASESSQENSKVELSETEINTIETEIEDDYSDYKKDLATIQGSNDKEIAESKKKVTENWIDAIDNEIIDVEDQLALASSPKEKAEKTQKLKILNDFKAEKEVDLNFIEEEITAIDLSSNTEKTNEVVVLTDSEKENIIKEEQSKFASFESKLENLNNIDNPTKDDLQQKIAVNEEWISFIDNDINETNNQLNREENRKEKEKLTTKIDWLKGQKTIKEIEQNELSEAITSINENETNSVIDENQIVDENQKAEDWLNIIDSDINDLEQKISVETNPQKKAELIAQKEKLENLKEEKQNVVETNTTIIDKSEAQIAVERSEEYADLVDEIETTSSIATDFEGSFSTDFEYESTEANSLKSKIAPKLEQLKNSEQEVIDLQEELKNTKKEKKKAAIQEQIDEKLIVQNELEILVSDEINKINSLEFESNQEELGALLNEKTEKDKSYIKDENYQLAKLLEEQYIVQNKQAFELIKEAGFIENVAAKSQKLKEANALQLAAIDNQKEAKFLLEETLEDGYTASYIGGTEDITANNSIRSENNNETESSSESILLANSYLENKQNEYNEKEQEYIALSSTEKGEYLTNWNSKVADAINENMKLLTSDIPDEQKDIISKNVEVLRTEQQNIRIKQQDLETLATTSTSTETENTTTSNEDNTNKEPTNSLDNNEDVATTSTSTETENTTTSNEDNTNKEPTNTSTNNKDVATTSTSTETENTTTSNEDNTSKEQTNTSDNNEDVATNTTSTETENTTTSNEDNTNKEQTNTSTNNEEVATTSTSTETENTTTSNEDNTNKEQTNTSDNNEDVATNSISTETENTTTSNENNTNKEQTNTSTNNEEVATNITSTETENTTTSNEDNTNKEPTNTSTNNEEVATNTTSTETENTTTSNEDNTNKEQTNSSNNKTTVATLSEQQVVFDTYENKIENTEDLEEKEGIYANWISKLENEIEQNEEAIKGNITIEEENVIEAKINWLEKQLEDKNDELAEIKNNILEENPVLATVQEDNKTITRETIKNSKLNENIDGIEFYSGKEELDTYVVSTNVETKELTDNIAFTSSVSNQIVEKNKNSISKVEKYESSIESLETQKEETTNEKTKESIEKKIGKVKTKKSKTEIKLANDIELATGNDNNLANEQLAESKLLLTDEIDENSFEYKQAQEYEEKAEQLKNEAEQLRSEAGSIKSVIEKSEQLNNALAKEQLSTEYKNKASKLYADAVVNSYKFDENKITAVSEREEERSSAKIRTVANQADNLAYQYSTRAGELRDSSETVKKKDKAKVIQEAEVYTQKANVQETIAQKLNSKADQIEAKELEVLENELLLTNLSQSDVEKVRTADNYDEIYAKQLAIEQFLKELKAEEEMMHSYMNLAKQQENKARKYEEKAKNASSDEEKQEFLAIADQLHKQAEVNRDKKDSIVNKIDEINEKKEVVEQEQFDLLSLFDEEFQNDIRGLMLSNYDKTPLEKEEEKPTLALNNLTSTKFEAPEDLTSNIVVINNDTQKSVYSESNPIPLNPKNPKGLVYKVQVGAFRKPIPQDLFKGFAPISAEKIRDDITRYRVGYFVNFETANVSKNQIRGLGYNDAFVVAILNGKRVSIAEARAYGNNSNTEVLAVNTSPKNTNTETPIETPSNSINENNTNASSNELNNEDKGNSTTAENDVPEYVRNLGEDAAEVNAVENIKGLFYTVQVGAFSKPIAKTGTFNISPLVTKFVNGLYKYTTGIYKSVQDADGRKNQVIAKGIPDAFVIAYYNGDRISLAKAQQIIQERGETAFSNKAVESTLNNNEPKEQTPINNKEESNSSNNLKDNKPTNGSDSNTERESNTSPVTKENDETLTKNNPFESAVVEENKEIINEVETENNSEEIENNNKSDLFTSSYLDNKKIEYQEIENKYTSIPASDKKEVLTTWKSKVDADINENMKLLISNIPDKQKNIISKNLEELRLEQQKVRNKQKELEAETEINSNVTNPIQENTEVNTSSKTENTNSNQSNNKETLNEVKEEENNSTYYVDLGVYYGTVPTPIAQSLLTNKKAKIKRNKINDAATQYYCGVFLTKDEVAEIWASFIEDGLEAKIVEIKEGETFILMEKEDQINEDIKEKENLSIVAADTKLVYRVELGTFEGTMPISTGKVFLELGYLGIEKKNYNNKHTYYCGKVDTEDEANELKQKFVDKGITDAKVVAFVGDREISLIEAEELSK